MGKKRVIFTLLYNDGNFMLSRNFRLQKAGNVNWLLKNYNFAHIAQFIDELIIVDVSRDKVDQSMFLDDVGVIAKNCFVPMAIGGSIQNFDTAARFISSGADKVVINSLFDTSPSTVLQISNYFGRQSIIGGVDIAGNLNVGYRVAGKYNIELTDTTPQDRIAIMIEFGAGEILLQSVDRDGTGTGFDLSIVALVDAFPYTPLIVSGGFGRAEHMIEALRHDGVDAVATSNLFNFIGDGLQKARQLVMDVGDINLPSHHTLESFGFNI